MIAADVIAMQGEPSRQTLRGYAALLDDEVVGLIGIARHKEFGLFFSEHKEALVPYLRSVLIWRAIKDAMQLVYSYRGPVLSVAEHAEGCRLLCRLGFTHLHGAWYGWLRQQR